MIALTLDDVALAVGGRLAGGAVGSTAVTGVSTDSRSVLPGDLFVAVVGEHHDAHEFGQEATAAGASAVLADRELEVACVVVDDDTVSALGRLARWVLAGLDLDVVGVTGSSGKTSTKDLLAQVLPLVGPTVAPAGSLNTEVGLPMTALTVSTATRVLVAEMGARGRGHVAYLCTITPPRVGVVLNVGSAHVGEFGGRDAIADAKGELVEALPAADAGGVAVLNADDPLVRAMAARTSAAVLLYGEAADADVRAVDVALDDLARPSFLLEHEGRSARVSLLLHGRHHVSNALAAATTALALGAGFDDVVDRLNVATSASRWRMDVTETPAGVTVVNDAYNANPESVRAALEALAVMGGARATRPARRTVAVLGEMRELGAESVREHARAGATAARLGVDRLVVVGHGAPAAALRAGAVLAGMPEARASLVADVDDAIRLLTAQLASGDVVLVKASRAAGLERVALALAGVPA